MKLINEQQREICQTNIVALTSYTNQKTIQECIDVGMCGFYNKPIKAHELRQVFNQFFSDLTIIINRTDQ